MFCDYFFTQFCTGRTYVKQTLDGAKNLNDSTEKQYDNFSPGIARLRTLSWFCEKMKTEEGDVAPTTFSCRLAAGKNVSREATKPRGCLNAALIPVF
jgi:hypothetical protein